MSLAVIRLYTEDVVRYLSEQKFNLVSGVVCGLTTVGVIAIYLDKRQRRNDLQLRVKKFLAARDGEMEKVRKEVGDIEEKQCTLILNYRLVDLLKGLRHGELDIVQTLKVYQKAALEAHKKTNCVVDFIPDALSRAIDLDAKSKTKDYVKPPLFGLPISLKASFGVENADLFCGYADDLEYPEVDYCLMVKRLHDLGAIPFVRTTVPLSLLTFSCENPVTGTTTHPCRTDRTPGGSSGGEAALIALRGSPLGIGSDVGGSIRIPAAFCGIAGLKPGSLRLAKFGFVGSVPGRSHTFASIGPMAMYAQDLAYFLKGLLNHKFISRNDPYIVPMPFNDDEYLSRQHLKIGYYDYDGWFRPTPAVSRAVNEAVERLKSHGHELIPFVPHNIETIVKLAYTAITFDNGEYLLERINDDLPVAGYSQMTRILALPVWLRRLISFLLKWKYPRLALLAGCVNGSVTDVRLTNAAIEKYQEDFAQHWCRARLDALICPVNVCPAMRHGDPYCLAATAFSTMLYNVLDYPAGTVPITYVVEDDCAKLESYEVNDPWDRKVVESAKDTVGLPVGVQVVAPPYTEELVLRLMHELQGFPQGSKDAYVK